MGRHKKIKQYIGARPNKFQNDQAISKPPKIQNGHVHFETESNIDTVESKLAIGNILFLGKLLKDVSTIFRCGCANFQLAH